MPQLDKLTILSQLVPFLVSFATLFFFLAGGILPLTYRAIKTRNIFLSVEHVSPIDLALEEALEDVLAIQEKFYLNGCRVPHQLTEILLVEDIDDMSIVYRIEVNDGPEALACYEEFGSIHLELNAGARLLAAMRAKNAFGSATKKL
jgi:Plant ATP synthase F0